MTTLTRDQAIAMIKAASDEVDQYGQDCGDVAEQCGANGGFGILCGPLMEHFDITVEEIHS